MATVPLGIANGAIDDFVKLASSAKRSGDSVPLAERELIQCSAHDIAMPGSVVLLALEPAVCGAPAEPVTRDDGLGPRLERSSRESTTAHGCASAFGHSPTNCEWQATSSIADLLGFDRRASGALTLSARLAKDRRSLRRQERGFTMSATLFVRHTVAEYDTWRKAYDDADSLRAKHGCTGQRVMRVPGDPNDVAATHEFPTLAQAEAFVNDPALKAGMEQGGVTSPPRIEIFENV